MAPWIVVLGAAGGAVTLALALTVFVLPLPPIVAVALYVVLGGLFLASVAIVGRLLVIEG